MALQRVPLESAQEEFPDHDLQEHLQSGGQKDVFIGSWNGEEIVLKTVIVDSYEASRRAKREAEAMEMIDSDILVDLKQSFPATIEDHDVFVMVEERVPGETLRDHLNNEGPSLNLGFDVVEHILTVLKEFNENDLVHRDIKPENIMITPGGDVKLLDVGIVRMLNEEGLTPTARSAAPGTPRYSAPEQLENEKEKQDTRTDLFSTGIVFYECITGLHPFEGKGPSIQEAIHTGDWMDLEATLDSDIAEDIDYYLELLLSPNMNARFNTPEMALDKLPEITDMSR